MEEPIVNDRADVNVKVERKEEAPQPEEKKADDNEIEERYEAKLIGSIQQFLYVDHYMR